MPNSTAQMNGESKKRSHAWADASDEEDTKNDHRLKGEVAKGEAGPARAYTNGRNKKPRRNFGMPNGVGVAGSSKLQNLKEQRRQLPIAKGREALIEEIRRHDVAVLLGETGSGKTTQVPQYLLESGIAGAGMIAVTQPRRVAATSLAARVAAEQDTSLGQLVGYSVRFDELAGPDTRIKYMTDGMLVRELLSDPLLTRYSVIIVDEAHERTLRTDLLITKLKTILKERNTPSDGKGKASESAGNPLKVIIMSATLDAEKFSQFYDSCKILYVKGRQHPVKIYHTAVGQPDYLDAALRTFFQIHVDQPPGDVLIFLPGQEDIESLDKSIRLYANRLPAENMGVVICPMFAALPPAQQAKIFQSTPPNTRKCILATNIAETSITIPGIKYVIDTGKHKEKRHIARDTGSGFDALLTRDITKSSAMQRAGRAGREGKGYCFRLYTEEAFDTMPVSSEPEIRRTSLTSAALQLKCLGEDIEDLDFLDRPDLESIHSALKMLWFLGAIDNTKRLTDAGRKMAALPLEPNLACAVLESVKNGCTHEVIDIVSVLSSTSKLFFDISDERENAFEARRKFRHPSGDHMTIVNTFRSYQDIAATESKAARKEWCRKQYVNERTLLEALKIRDQLRATCDKMGIDWRTTAHDDEKPVTKSLFRGLVLHSALLQPDGTTFKQVYGRSVIKIHPSSSLADKKIPAIIYDELVYTNHIYARGVSAVPKAFLSEMSNQIKDQIN
ncbi:P-loop containing nucleoside triphosphate hydrolase protein [Gloeophyllum trabeum ATCC 11539]|uniref:RNA helicase n=1 Tax=Gloeophyllum trabeum (strain ATCC 11539 / FP-39264 / Madison 617) TaxID=670483 RepID=S7Q585_GLOTA|nr:P-loop containing nucleoside triphosphate hydrolase protein [Gloeophyllum trabeum ATCC 11539]EPQ54668.1 P-loop containing nucleoside triphosphate hydrolase protein [Gloeophyllum trabeum ATCC 11539]